MKRRLQTNTEEWFNTISHGIAALASTVGFVLLVMLGNSSELRFTLFSAIVFGVSLVLLYTFSTIYHGARNEKTKKVFQILDHCGIYLLIAGTYTPVLLVSIGGTTGWVIFGVQWTIAFIGLVIKIFYTGKFDLISTLMYAVMGWMIVIRWQDLVDAIPSVALTLLLAGGISYTVGIVFYLIDTRIKFSHFIWHLFVMAGSLFHYIMIVKYVFV
ncbi:MAG: hemolysin III family protein [Bacteroidetes bacterium]|jgi:hemolysin III|nr:hemolysin III family protein [Bacteroidota bacterium]MDA0732441.1 hemolysin III family protein [Bacteroidota bacterium]MDA0980906.1 hemolysin III family protein [Bacteroidota bacterium]